MPDRLLPFLSVALITCGSLSQVRILASEADVVYGVDSRREAMDSSNSDLVHTAAQSVALMISQDEVISEGNHSPFARLVTTPVGEAENFCRYERFYSQPSAGFCTAFLIAPDIVATAGHCIEDHEDCADTSFVFDYAYPARATESQTLESVVRIKKSSIARCKEIIYRVNTATSDFALLRLNRKIEDRPALPLRKTGKVSNDVELMVIGHGLGLPLKVADGSTILDNSGRNSLNAAIDGFQGNSGSPVLDPETGVVEGIYTSGQDDFRWTGKCYESVRCDDSECSGEEVMRAKLIAAKMP